MRGRARGWFVPAAAGAALAAGLVLLAPGRLLAVMLLLAGFLTALLYARSQRAVCRCPECDQEREIAPFTDLMHPHTPPTGQYTWCPRCERREWVEVFVRERR